MALKESKKFETNFEAPNFKLLNTKDGNIVSLEVLKGEKGTVILFICNHCPYVLHINDKLVEVANRFQAKGINFVAISSNDVISHPQDGPVQMKTIAEEMRYPFPYLYDETQEVAKAYDAVCTPDIYAFDENLKLAYHGQFDDSRPGNQIAVTGKDLSNALGNMLSKSPIFNQKPSMGCNIKWK